MTTRSCPDWPEPDGDRARAPVQALHAARGARSPPRRSSTAATATSTSVEICCDLDSHVFNADHTDPIVAEALRATHWFDLRECAARGPADRA